MPGTFPLGTCQCLVRRPANGERSRTSRAQSCIISDGYAWAKDCMSRSMARGLLRSRLHWKWTGVPRRRSHRGRVASLACGCQGSCPREVSIACQPGGFKATWLVQDRSKELFGDPEWSREVLLSGGMDRCGGALPAVFWVFVRACRCAAQIYFKNTKMALAALWRRPEKGNILGAQRAVSGPFEGLK